jgi:hypothetical protein
MDVLGGDSMVRSAITASTFTNEQTSIISRSDDSPDLEIMEVCSFVKVLAAMANLIIQTRFDTSIGAL